MAADRDAHRAGDNMAAYLIAEVEVTDPVAYESYRPLAAASIARHGGKYIVRGGATEPLEGAAPNRVVVLEFASLAAARAFYTSQDYSEALEIRKAASRSRVFLVEGM
jgi:uncharacterized protein (DUF1330 family)